ncbi:hypothetical protein G7Y89_g2619 [Cudoniella acicularis]|uniref:Uncharacterized protein n=1 Tax=Cudoniella acicularis TaxID=354080 RepID=A0A8H4RTS3_9HELO|nr:hypothetical protein G7Y89_g2619 [Cudoniella acicularis]
MPLSPYSQRRVVSKPGDDAYWIVKGPARDVQEILVDAGVVDLSAKDAARNAFKDWTSEEVRASLKKFDGAIKNLKTVERTQWIERDWIKPPRRLWSQAAESNLALCVNRSGEFDLRMSEYVAISHVWSEGMWGDDKNRGIPRYVLDKLFEHLKPLDVSWIWLDPLAVPGGLLQLSTFEENIKVALINQMATIYERARCVVVMDALVMKMPSTDPFDVAFALCCGKWRARLWTFQEAKLAFKVVVLTGSGVVDYHELVNTLGAMAGFDKQHRKTEGDSDATPDQRRLAKQPYFALRYLVRWPNVGMTLVDLVRACTVRDVSYEIDNARALYPSLGLKWTEMTREEGIAKIYRARKEESMQLVMTWGSPRCLEGYAWAPAYLNGLRHYWISGNTWEVRGIRNSWYTYKVRKLLPDFSTKAGSPFGNMALEIETEDPLKVWAGKFWVHESEREEARTGFLEEVEKGQGYIISQEGLGGSSELVLFVKRTKVDANEVSIFLTAFSTWQGETTGEKFSNQPEHPTKVELLLKHQSPLNIEDTSLNLERVDSSEFLAVTKAVKEPEHHNESPLQIAIRSGEIANVVSELKQLGKKGLKATDSEGWTALHTATYLDFTEAVTLLLDKSMWDLWLNRLTTKKESALVFACQNSNLEIATTLIKRGAKVFIDDVDILQPLQAALQPRNRKANPEIVELILETGGDVNIPNDQGEYPIFFALENPKLLEILLSKGADPVCFLPNGKPPIIVAASYGYAHAIPLLVNAGSPIDILENGYTALERAVRNQNESAVNECIKAQANVNRIFPDGETVIMISAKLGNYEITNLLLKNGARLHFRDKENGATALQWAIEGGHARVVKLFMQHLNTDKLEKDNRMILRSRTRSGDTASDLAKRSGNPDIAKLLENHGDQRGLVFNTTIHVLIFSAFAGSTGIAWKVTAFFLRRYRKTDSVVSMIGLGTGVGVFGLTTTMGAGLSMYVIGMYWDMLHRDLL